jgi:hypothetical protein
MSKNGSTTVANNNNNNTKKIKFNLNKSVQVTKVFAREDVRLTKNDTIFTMVDTNNPGMVNRFRKRTRDCLKP